MSKVKQENLIARTYRVTGRVQDVGFRYFVKYSAEELGVRGFVRNEDDGSVFVYAVSDPVSISHLAGAIRKGPQHAEVRTVEEKEAAVEKYFSFHID